MSAHGFRFSFIPLPRCFSPFPHGTLRYRSHQVVSLGGVVPPASDGIPRVPPYSRACPASIVLPVQDFHLLRSPVPGSVPVPRSVAPPRCAASLSTWRVSQPPASIGSDPTQLARFRLRPVRSPLLGPSQLMSSRQGTKMFQFPHVPPDAPQRRVTPIARGRVAPFGDPRIRLVDSSPWHFAVCPRPSSARCA